MRLQVVVVVVVVGSAVGGVKLSVHCCEQRQQDLNLIEFARLDCLGTHNDDDAKTSAAFSLAR